MPTHARHSNGRREGNTLFVERFTFDPQKLSLRRDRSVTDPAVIGQVSHGLQRITAITGGKVRGPSMKGVVVPNCGADWQLIQPDEFSELDTRFTLRLESALPTS